MGKKIIRIFLVVALGAASYQAQAYHVDEVNVEADINIKTHIRDCEPYARDIVELCKLSVACEVPAEKLFVYEQIAFLKEQLTSCEKSNKKKVKDSNVKIGTKIKNKGK